MRIVDLFAGCGGMSLGFQKAGFDLVAAFEKWPVAAECHRANFDHPVYETDLSDVEEAVTTISALKPDVIIGGPPCQDFSSAGKRIEAGRAGLTESFARIVSEVRPLGFVMENVDRARKSQAYAVARSIFKEAGYGLTEVVLDASYCGVPQKRKRFFCIGMLGQTDGYALQLLQERLSDKPMTVREYFGGKLDFEYYYRHPRNYNRRAVFSIDESAPTVRGVNSGIAPGYQGNPSDACPVSQVTHALTTLDRAMLQTFPENFKWVGKRTEVERMIGNAVPVNLAAYVAAVLKEVMEDMLRRIEEAKTVRYQLSGSNLELSVTKEGLEWIACAYDRMALRRSVVMCICNPTVTSADQIARRIEDDYRRDPEMFYAMVRGEM